MARHWTIRVVIGLLIAFFFTGIMLRVFSPVRATLLNVLAPPLLGLRATFSMVGEAWNTTGFTSHRAIQGLENEKAELNAELLTERAKLEEYKIVLKEYARFPTPGANVIVAPVLSRTLDSFASALTVAAGEKQGMAEGAVASSHGALVGFVRNAGKNKSAIEFFFAPFLETPGILADGGMPLLLEGHGAGILTSKVPRDVPVEKGAVVINNAAERLIIGKVVSITNKPQSPFLELIIRSPVNPSTIQEVFIIK